MRVIFVRHCLTDWNAQKRIQGHTDIPLNRVGREQAEIIASALGEQNVTRIISSSLSRASETATIIGAKLHRTVDHDKRLMECGFGTLEGKTLDDVAEIIGGVMPPAAAPYDFRAWGGEHRDGVLARTLAALADALAEPSEGAVILVGHGRSHNTLLHHLGEAPLPDRADWRIIDVRLP
ncbi:histidine phosphatase family protein [Patescibacteria group bacterium]|nr:MAG: histidine phosphatase family protein [Patescibacteria group bacterium]